MSRAPRLAAAAWIVAAVGLVAVPVGVALTGERASFFTRDVFSIASIPVYAGLISNLGIFLWCATAAVCLFAAALARDPEAARFLAASGLFSGLLLVDDFFMVHEWIVPRLLHVSEKSMYGVYAVLGLAWLWRFRRRILTGRPGLLALALGLFALSILFDFLEPAHPPGIAPGWRYMIEEGPKLVGIATWAAYLALESARALEAP